MKRHLQIVLILGLTAFVAVSCKQKQLTRQEQIEEFRSGLTAEDTTTMLRMCDEAMEQLKGRNIDNVLATLYEYTDSNKEVKPLSKEATKRYRRMFELYPVLNYERKYFSFQLEGCNDVKYDVEFMSAEAAGTDEPAVTSYMFNPVKIDGEWKLCVKTPMDEIDLSKQ